MIIIDKNIFIKFWYRRFDINDENDKSFTAQSGLVSIKISKNLVFKVQKIDYYNCFIKFSIKKADFVEFVRQKIYEIHRYGTNNHIHINLNPHFVI